MKTIKLSENMKEIEIEKKETDFEEFEEDFDLEETRPIYEVWLLAYDEKYNILDFNYFIDDFNSPIEAKKCHDFFAIKENLAALQDLVLPEKTAHVFICVETTIPDEDDGGTINIGTLNETEVF